MYRRASRRRGRLPTQLAGGAFDPAAVNTVSVGDSLTYGTASTSPGGATAYPALLSGTATNYGVPSLTSRDLPDPDHLLDPTKSNRLVVMIGVNDIFSYGETAADTYARLAAYVTAREASGWNVVVCTLTGVPIGSSGEEAIADDYNDLIRAGFSYVADVAADPDIGLTASGGAPYYDADGIHLTDAGYAKLAAIIDPVGANVALPTIETSFGPLKSASLTGWYRDWWRTDKLATEWEVGPWYEISDGSQTDREMITSGASSPPYRVSSAINGHPSILFTGVASARYIAFEGVASDYVTASEFITHTVCKVTSIATDSATLHLNDGVWSGGNGIFALNLRSTSNTLIGFVFATGPAFVYVTLTGVPIDTWTVLSMRLVGGQLGIRIGTTGAWTETSCGNLFNTTDGFRIGSDGTGSYRFNGEQAEMIVRNSYDADELAADMAYLEARYDL